MQRWLILFSCILPTALFGAGSAHAATSTSAQLDDGLQAQGSVGLRGNAFQDETDRAQSMGLFAELGVLYRLGTDWKANIDIGARLESGSSQSYLSTEYRPTRSIQLFEAAVAWTPASQIAVKAGSLNQGFHRNPLLFSYYESFPGVLESFTLGGSSNASANATENPVRLELSAEQAIPTGESTSNNPAGGSSLPFFHSERAELTWAIERNRVQAHAGHFSFRSLPNTIALESRLLGNDVGGIGPSSAFISAFDGVEGGLSFLWGSFASVRPLLGMTFVANLSAPTGRGNALLAYAEVGYAVSPQLTLTPRLDLFRSEGDAAIGSYSAGSLGHGNRTGFNASLRAELADSGVSLSAEYLRASVIAPTPFQSDLAGFVFNLRKTYVLNP